MIFQDWLHQISYGPSHPRAGDAAEIPPPFPSCPPWRPRTFTSCWSAPHAWHGSTVIMVGRQTEQRHRQGRHFSCAGPHRCAAHRG